MSINKPIITQDETLRPTHIEIDLAVLGANLQAIRALQPQLRYLFVLKANAYGHGMVEVAAYLQSLNVVDYLAVAVLEEGIQLRRAGVTVPILVLGGIVSDQIPLFLQHQLTLTASSVDKLRQIDQVALACQQRARVHLKIDTGMERIGVHYYSAQGLLEASLACQSTEVEGIYTHLANADADSAEPTEEQLARFAAVCDFYTQRQLPMPLRHIANSAAFLRFPQTHLDMVRIGKLLYGIYPDNVDPSQVLVRSAFTWKSHVVYFKVVEAGHPVSYGSTWAPERQTRMVTIPVGFGDGYFRAMSGKAQVLIRGKRYPVRGRICMDQMVVDIGWDEAYNGDPVVLLGRQGEAEISFYEMASWVDTLPSEILTHINTRVPRLHRLLVD